MHLDDALERAGHALRRAVAAGVDEAEVRLTLTSSGVTRFARSAIHQDLDTEEVRLDVRVVRDGAEGWAGTGQLDADGLDRAARTAAANARTAPPWPDWPGLPRVGAGRIEPPDEPPPGPEERARAVTTIVAAGCEVEMHGLVQTDDTVEVVLNSRGLLAAQRRPSAWVVALAMAGTGTGYQEQRAARLATVDAAALAARAADVARRTRERATLDPGRYRVVLGEHAAADLLAKTARLTFTGAAVATGASAFAPGRRLGSPAVTIVDDGTDPAGVPSAFDAEGVPRRPVTLLRAGECVEVVHDTVSAARLEARSTGHALPRPDAVGPLGRNLFLAPGRRSRAELIADVADGVLIERLYYTNPLDPRRVLMTGSTRDGVFRIRDGALAEAVSDVRVQLSYLDLLANTVEVGAERRTVSGWYGGVHVLGDVTVPALRVDDVPLG